MRKLFLTALLILPVAALAQDASPLLVTSPAATTPAAAPASPPDTYSAAEAVKPAANVTAAEQILSAFPDWAVTKAGADTTGQYVPAVPSGPPVPASPAVTPATPAIPGNAAPVPVAPARPDKLWPKDTVPIFLRACTGFHPELVAPCNCVISKLMVTMPHDEFIALTADNKLAADARYTTIRQSCLGTPGKRADDSGK